MIIYIHTLKDILKLISKPAAIRHKNKLRNINTNYTYWNKRGLIINDILQKKWWQFIIQISNIHRQTTILNINKNWGQIIQTRRIFTKKSLFNHLKYNWKLVISSKKNPRHRRGSVLSWPFSLMIFPDSPPPLKNVLPVRL